MSFILGNTYLAMKAMSNANPTKPQISSGRSGSSWMESSSAPASVASTSSSMEIDMARFLPGLSSLDREREDEAQQGQRLDNRDADEHVGADDARCLRLTRHSLDGAADQNADADAGPDRGQAVPDDVQTAFHKMVPFCGTQWRQFNGGLGPL